MSEAEIALNQPCALWAKAVPGIENLCRRVVGAALDGAAEALPPVARDRLEISVVLADDAMVRDLNNRYRGQDKATNVLSFAALDDEDEVIPAEGPVLLGDIILAYETTSAEAVGDDKPFADHLTHLLTHGVLHLLGYDHLEDAEAEEMEAMERSILAGLGIADPYDPPLPS